MLAVVFKCFEHFSSRPTVKCNVLKCNVLRDRWKWKQGMNSMPAPYHVFVSSEGSCHRKVRVPWNCLEVRITDSNEQYDFNILFISQLHSTYRYGENPGHST